MESILLPWLHSNVSPSPGNGFGLTAASSALPDEGCSISGVIFSAFCHLLCVCACVCVDVYLGSSMSEELSYEAVVSAQSRLSARTVCTTGAS